MQSNPPERPEKGLPEPFPPRDRGPSAVLLLLFIALGPEQLAGGQVTFDGVVGLLAFAVLVLAAARGRNG